MYCARYDHQPEYILTVRLADSEGGRQRFPEESALPPVLSGREYQSGVVQVELVLLVLDLAWRAERYLRPFDQSFCYWIGSSLSGD